jgi:hypothetical protein
VRPEGLPAARRAGGLRPGAADGFAFDAEVLFLACRLGLRVAEVPVRAEQRSGSKVQLAVDAARMLRDVVTVARLAATGSYDLPSRGQPHVPADRLAVEPALPAAGAGPPGA